MNSLKLYYKITIANNCPLYTKGEILELSEKTLTCPEQKPTCLILVREMTKLLFEHLGGAESAGKKEIHSCSGCTGLIKFVCISEIEAKGDSPVVGGLVLAPEERALLDEIHTFPLIQIIPECELERAVHCFRKQTLAAGSTLILKGQSSLYLYLILTGELVVGERSFAFATLGPGDICGEMSYLGDEAAGSDVRTVTEVEVLSITGDAFCRMVDRIPELQLFMAKVLAQRLRVSNASHFDTFDACMSGWVREMPPAELFQIFHMNKKTGVLSLELPGGGARVSFREGCVINAQYGKKSNQSAIFTMLKEKEGRYTFTTGLTPEEMKAAEIGDFMGLLMEGIKRVDEGSGEEY